jgi:predicted Zn-dependent protease
MRTRTLLALIFALAATNMAVAQQPRRAGAGDPPAAPVFPGLGAAPAGQNPFFDPQKMFDQIFGEVPKLDDAALAKVEVTAAEEAKLGKQGLEAAKQQFAKSEVKLLTRGKEVEYLTRLVELVRPRMTQADRYERLHVYLIDSQEPAAYSLPGGHVLFSRGLLDAAGCEAALVVTAGHELSHIDRGHLLRRTREWKLAHESFAPGKAGGQAGFVQMMSLMPRLFQRPFGPEEELEADRDGITWAYGLGYDPRAVQLVFDALEAKFNENGFGGLPAFLRTHPASAERHENLKKTFAELATAGQGKPLYIGRQNAQRRLTRQEREFME